MKECYEVKPEAFWESTWRYGDGYDVMGVARRKGWREIASWGEDGWDLGSWPYVIVFFRQKGGCFEVVEYVEGDVTKWVCPTVEIRNQIIDEIAFRWWKQAEESWVKGYESVDELPETLKGPYRVRS